MGTIDQVLCLVLGDAVLANTVTNSTGGMTRRAPRLTQGSTLFTWAVSPGSRPDDRTPTKRRTLHLIFINCLR